MIDDRSLERAARSWIEVGPTLAPEEAVDAALLRIQTTPQERDWLPWRLPRMTTPLRLALLVGAAVLAIAGIGLLAGGGPGIVPVPTPSPTPSPGPSLGATPAKAMPERLWGDWQAETEASIAGVSAAGERIQLSLDWQNGESAWIQSIRGTTLLHSSSAEAPTGEIRLVWPLVTGCPDGTEGRYAWERPGDGEFLTLTLIEDACASRAEAFARTWVHSLSAVTDGGPGVIPWTDRWIRATLPAMRFGLSGANDVADFQTFDAGDPTTRFLVFQDPMGDDDPCASGGGRPLPVPSTGALIEYLGTLPGATVSSADGVIDGRPATHLTVEISAEGCPSGAVAALHPRSASDEGTWSFAPGTTHSLWVVDVDGDTFLFWYEGEDVTPADEQAVIDSLRFVDALPTP